MEKEARLPSWNAREAGYEYVTEVDGSKLFRKRKQIWLLLLLLLNLLNV